MTRTRRVLSLAIATVVFALVVSAVEAQTRVRVTRDQTTIWRAGFITAATIVQTGAVLDVVARRGNWYEVVLPLNEETPRATGFIAVNRVEAWTGEPRPAVSDPPSAPPPQTRTARRPPVPPSLQSKGVRGFAGAAYGRFAAHQSFEAVLGKPGGPWYGGGVEVRRGPWFVEGAAEWFRQAGERAFIFNGSVFKLGIPDTITVIPVMGTVGYRRQYTPGLSLSASGGIGRYWYEEESTVAGSSEVFRLQATSYHTRAALEWHKRGLVATAVELQYTWVPDALTGGVAATVDEHDLGGIQARVKILLGR